MVGLTYDRVLKQEMSFQPNSSMCTTSTPDSPNTMTTDMPVMSPWMQIPPSVMPWTLENRPQVVRFGDRSGESDPWSLPPKIKFFKRKSDLDHNPKPAKLHISEEKMTDQLKNMHISNSYEFEDDMEEPRDCLLPTLVLSKEVQNLPTFHEALPDCLLRKVERPTQALMLWKPPTGSITSQLISRLEDSEGVDNANNNTSTPDLNSMTSSPGYSSEVTAMEL